ncbi:DUF4383 domain-containing protein [Streptomyces durbertensis]|uniref:DUF4383 domain-containing protein n=1 Tax=Streptomyces durbertensis TaxID=2448886 RepID=A0ABR6EMT5_9ACTN|nr:DUF4383 domain-containing protein [Streptomyces durbertensis]MBB1246657.1 DUF4383 domain-containing protein [Streptomyces durbertensis]
MNAKHNADPIPRGPLGTAAVAVGVVFLLVGLLGFVPGITTNLGELEFAGHESNAKLFGVFQVSVLHNLVHVLFGLAGLLMARTAPLARTYLLVGGLIYLALWVYGLVIDKDHDANFVPVNTADDWLHFALGIGMVGLGLILGRGHGRRRV